MRICSRDTILYCNHSLGKTVLYKINIPAKNRLTIFKALHSSKASVVTDMIRNITNNSIELASGTVLYQHVVGTATGLRLLFAGGINVTLNHEPIDVSKVFLWKGTMLQDVPSLFATVGFENAAWTLGCDCASYLAIRVRWRLTKANATVLVAQLDQP